jgi:hypothetical protein
VETDTVSDRHLPPADEIYPRKDFAARHPNLLSENRLYWAVRNRKKNGLQKARAVFESPCGELLIHEPAFLAWFFGLAGRAKPRAVRKRSVSAAASAA